MTDLSGEFGREGERRAKPTISRIAFLRGSLAVGALASVPLLSACTKDSDPPVGSAAPTTGGAARSATGTIAARYAGKKIGVVHLTKADENETTLVTALKEASTKAGAKWNFLEADAQGDQAKAQQAVSAFITQKVDAIILLVVSSRLVAAQLADAKAAGIPVFGMWSFSELDPNLTADYTSVPAADASALAGYMFGSLVLSKPQGDIQIALVNTNLDILQARNAVVRGLAPLYPRVRIVDSADIDFTDIVGTSTNITNAFLQKYPDLDAIWTAYPLSGPAAAQAILAARRTVKVYTHVAESQGLKALADPANPLQAMPWLDFDWQSYHVVETMLAHFAGQEIDRLRSYELIVPFQVFTKKTVATGATGAGVASGIGWTQLDGVWKQPLVESWLQTFAS